MILRLAANSSFPYGFFGKRLMKLIYPDLAMSKFRPHRSPADRTSQSGPELPDAHIPAECLEQGSFLLSRCDIFALFRLPKTYSTMRAEIPPSAQIPA
jgi:hypothetical protein